MTISRRGFFETTAALLAGFAGLRRLLGCPQADALPPRNFKPWDFEPRGFKDSTPTRRGSTCPEPLGIDYWLKLAPRTPPQEP